MLEILVEILVSIDPMHIPLDYCTSQFGNILAQHRPLDIPCTKVSGRQVAALH